MVFFAECKNLAFLLKFCQFSDPVKMDAPDSSDLFVISKKK